MWAAPLGWETPRVPQSGVAAAAALGAKDAVEGGPSTEAFSRRQGPPRHAAGAARGSRGHWRGVGRFQGGGHGAGALESRDKGRGAWASWRRAARGWLGVRRRQQGFRRLEFWLRTAVSVSLIMEKRTASGSTRALCKKKEQSISRSNFGESSANSNRNSFRLIGSLHGGSRSPRTSRLGVLR